jgi:nitrite reductase/ring-hydroxylating ferredoxin subunit
LPEILACKVDQLSDGESLKVAGDPDIAVHRVDGEFFATSDMCTHEDWSLGEDGDLEGHKIIDFPATEPLKTFRVRVSGDEVWVDLH